MILESLSVRRRERGIGSLKKVLLFIIKLIVLLSLVTDI